MTTLKYSGNGLSKGFLPDIEGVIVLEPGTTTTLSNAKLAAGWAAHICPATSAAIVGTYINLRRGIEDKTTAPEFTTANTGMKEKTKDFAWECTGYGFMSYRDYRTWFAADGKDYDFVFVLANGTLLHCFDTSGNVIGFSGAMFVNYGIPKPGGDGKQKACPFDIMLDSIDQMKGQEVTETAFSRRELEELVPVGINIEVTSAYNAGALTVKATHRVTGLPYAGFTTSAEWKVVSTTTDNTAVIAIVSAAGAAIGVYTLTVYVTGTTPMTGSFEIQAEKIETSVVTYLSQVINVAV
jgi:hypothetical protein